MRIREFAAAAALGLAALGLSACATGLPTRVSRFQIMPPPAGQTFYVAPQPGGPAGLEFSGYATLVAQHLRALGYVPAATPQSATMLVKLGYGVDQGRTEIYSDPLSGGYGGYGGFYGGFGRSPFYYGWHDPFFYGGHYGRFGYGSIRGYTVYTSFLDLDIVRRSDNAPLFEGLAKARSQTDNLTVLVPNLIQAMFTGFPGRNGETIRITIPAKPKA